MNTNTSLLFQIPPFLLLLHSTKTSHHSLSFSLRRHKSLSSSFHVRRLPSSNQTMPPPPAATETTFDDEEEFQDQDQDEEDVFVPLSNMRQWTRNKPRGFGEGKVYDTSLEDKLLQELDHARAAQLLNINNLNNPNQLPKHNNKEPPPSGFTIRVRLANLPKKKNIHRDLQAAFKPFPGILNIIPAVSGNQKTRDPVCKGFAFVHFNSHKEANRFVDIFSRQPITFGKVQKQIRCEIMEPSVESPLPVLSPTMAPDPCVEDELTLYNVDDEADESLKKQKAVREKEKKTTRAKNNTPKQNIPGSANRLKMKEKALLSGVFSKYGGKSSD